MPRISRSVRWVVQIAAVSAVFAIGPVYGVLAQSTTPSATSQATSTATPTAGSAAATPKIGPASKPGPKGGRGPNGGDPISRAGNEVTRAKTDLAAAQGKMDVSLVQSWIDQAAALLQSAQSDQIAGKGAAAREEAGSAQELAMAADQLMVTKLGSQLPSQANRPAPPTPPAPPSGTTAPSPQARVSRDLAHTYKDILSQRDGLNAANLGSSWPDVLKQAEDQYKDAYTEYQSGNYDQAAASIQVAGHLARAIDHALHVSSDPTKPVSVPAPQF